MGADFIARHTFDSFVVGTGNRDAYDAAQSVVQCSGKTSKPLALCGGAGTGKTHLIRAIRNRFTMQARDDVAYYSIESLTNAMVEAIRRKDLASFTNSFHELDVLLIDDIQFLFGKERTQEAFMHVSSDLLRHGKQIVAGGCRSKKEFADLAGELNLSLDSWLCVEIEPPDCEMMLAILRQKAGSASLTLPEDCQQFIAANAHDVRTLEGAVAMLTAYTSLCEAPLCLQTAQRILSHMKVA